MVHRVFRLRITPERAPDVYRTIDFDGHHTLDDVHVAIQREFELDDDHLHAFYLSGEYFDRKTEVEAGERRGQSARRPLFRLGLEKGGRFAHLFDFGDELRHRIDVVDVVDVSRPIERPTLVEAVGAAPPQYDRGIDDGLEDDDEIDEGLSGDGFGEDEKGAEDAELEARLGVLLPIVKRLDSATSDANPTDGALSAAKQAALELASGLAGDRELLAELEVTGDYDVLNLLLDLPFALAKAGRIDDAEAVARSFAPFDSESFLGDLGVLLAEAGKGEAALRQVEQNLELYGNDEWVRIKAADVFAKLGAADRAETEYRQVFGATWDPFARAGALERLCPLLEIQGRAEEAKALLAAEERDAALTAVRSSPAAARSAPKVGRNDPCPCGSGRKFKKCCGGV